LASVKLAPLKNLSNAMGLATDGPRHTGVDSPRDPLMVAVQKLVQGVDVIYRIGKQTSSEAPCHRPVMTAEQSPTVGV